MAVADDVVSWKHLMALNIVWCFGVFAAAGASCCVARVDLNSALNSHDSMRLMTFEMKRTTMWIGVIAFVVVVAAATESFAPSDLTMP